MLSPGSTGLYGVDCEYVMATTNSHTAAAYGWVRLAARNTGSPYFGAVEGPMEIEDDKRTAEAVPPIVWGSSFPIFSDKNAVAIRNADYSNAAAVLVGPSANTYSTVRLANAGSATMPACLEYDAMAMYPQEPA